MLGMDVIFGLGFLGLIILVADIILLVYLFKKIKSLDKRNAELKHVEEHVIKMSELIIQNNEFIAKRIKTLENKEILSQREIEHIKEILGLKD